MSRTLGPPDATWCVGGETVEVRYRFAPDGFLEPITLIVAWPADAPIPEQPLRTVEELRRRWGHETTDAAATTSPSSLKPPPPTR